MKILLTIILILYFVFTSGFVFEIINSESINKLDIPYSAISGERTGVIGTFFTQSDIDCAKWLAQGKDKKSLIYADINGQLLLSGYVEPYTQIVEIFSFKLFFEEPCFIFITEWNIKHNKMVWHNGQPGMREYGPIPEEIKNKQLVFSKGEAKIYK